MVKAHRFFIYFLLASCLALTRSGLALDIDEYQHCADVYQARDWANAAICLAGLAAEYPGEKEKTRARFLQGVVELEQQHFAEAEKIFDDNEGANWIFHRGLAKLGAGDTKAAKKLFDSIPPAAAGEAKSESRLQIFQTRALFAKNAGQPQTARIYFAFARGWLTDKQFAVLTAGAHKQPAKLDSFLAESGEVISEGGQTRILTADEVLAKFQPAPFDTAFDLPAPEDNWTHDTQVGLGYLSLGLDFDDAPGNASFGESMLAVNASRSWHKAHWDVYSEALFSVLPLSSSEEGVHPYLLRLHGQASRVLRQRQDRFRWVASGDLGYKTLIGSADAYGYANIFWWGFGSSLAISLNHLVELNPSLAFRLFALKGALVDFSNHEVEACLGGRGREGSDWRQFAGRFCRAWGSLAADGVHVTESLWELQFEYVFP